MEGAILGCHRDEDGCDGEEGGEEMHVESLIIPRNDKKQARGGDEKETRVRKTAPGGD